MQIRAIGKNRDIEKLVNDKMLPIRKNAESGGRILKDHMPPPGYVDDFRNVVKRDNGDDIFYPLNHSKNPAISDTGFSIIIKNTDFDVEPVISLIN